MEKLLPLPEVEAAVGFKKSQIYALMKKGQFPAAVAIGASRRWKASDVQAWIAEKISQSAAGAGARPRVAASRAQS